MLRATFSSTSTVIEEMVYLLAADAMGWPRPRLTFDPALLAAGRTFETPGRRASSCRSPMPIFTPGYLIASSTGTAVVVTP